MVPSLLRFLLLSTIAFTLFTLWFPLDIIPKGPDAELPPKEQQEPAALLQSGWDDNGYKLYHDRVERLKNTRIANINLANHGNVTVSTDPGGFGGIWRMVDGTPSWESYTFEIFKKYVTPETIVIDFGTWIGPTLLFHAQLSKHSYGIEADPVAFAIAEFNVNLNRDKKWGNRVTMVASCVSAPQHVGNMTMRGASAPGASMSGISEKLARRFSDSWNVYCYTLPDILNRWKIDLLKQPVMIKIDVESYECKLMSSFYDWLKNEPVLPTIYVSFHPRDIADCTETEWSSILETIKLYETVSCCEDSTKLNITQHTTLKDLDAIKTARSWAKEPYFVLSGKKR